MSKNSQAITTEETPNERAIPHGKRLLRRTIYVAVATLESELPLTALDYSEGLKDGFFAYNKVALVLEGNLNVPRLDQQSPGNQFLWFQ